jgi:glycine hydroxymethyltransferase
MSEPFWGPDFGALQATDPDIAGVVLDELTRLRGGLQLIASENLTSSAVLAALGSTLSNKYAEGYPGRRYYGGCEVVDRAEIIGIERAKELFGAEHANLQPHSGASANFAAYAALASPGEKVLAMSLPHGGHLTHGSKVSFSGKWFDVAAYGVREDTELIDYDEVRDLARQHQPKLIICGATAYSRLIDFAAFRSIADEVGAYRWSTPLTSSGWSPARRSRARCPTPTSSPSPRTRCCVARAAAWCCALRSWPPRSTRRSSPSLRGVR